MTITGKIIRHPFIKDSLCIQTRQGNKWGTNTGLYYIYSNRIGAVIGDTVEATVVGANAIILCMYDNVNELQRLKEQNEKLESDMFKPITINIK